MNHAFITTAIVLTSALTLLACSSKAPKAPAKDKNAASQDTANTPAPSKPAQPTATAALDGAALAKTHCGGCHKVPSPQDLPSESWPFVLGWMDNYLGHPNITDDNRGLVVRQYVPATPPITDAQRRAIHKHYLDNAAPQAKMLAGRQDDWPQIDLFEPSVPEKLGLTPHDMTTLLHLDEANGRLYVGTGRRRQLHIFNPATGQRFDTVQMPTEPVTVTPQGPDKYRLTLMGSFDFDEGLGQIRQIEGFGDQRKEVALLVGAHRLTQSLTQDLDADGRPDMVMVGFGDGYGPGGMGTLSVLWQLPDYDKVMASPPSSQPLGPLPGTFSVDPLVRQAGPLNSVVADFNKDGKPDIALAMAQGHQQVLIFENKGTRKFERHTIMDQHPGFGFNHVSAADFDNDGLLDLVVTNGNNMEQPNPPLRPYHGVRILKNLGDFAFKEVAFIPVHGTMEAASADFDNDGDLDIAATAFFPDWTQDRPQTFVYLRNDGQWRFTPHRLPDATPWGRWMRLTVGDATGDGAPDIILGSGSIPMGIPKGDYAKWESKFASVPAVLLLRHK